MRLKVLVNTGIGPLLRPYLWSRFAITAWSAPTFIIEKEKNHPITTAHQASLARMNCDVRKQCG